MKTSLTGILTTCAALLLGSLAVPARADILYVANEGNNTIERFSASGSDLGTFASSPVFGAAPFGIAFDSAANLYVAYPNITTNMAEFSATGTLLFSFGWPELSFAQGIAFDGAGNLYVADAVHNSIEKFSATGTDLGTFANSGLDLPRGIAFDSAGNLYAANEGDNTIEEFSPAGTDLGAFASSSSAHLSFPFGLAFDGAGNLYVANLGLHEIEKFSPTGVDLGEFASTGTTPEGLAFDSAGNLYVACQGGPVIEKFTPGGAGSVFASGGVSGPTFLAFTDDAGNPLPLPPPPPATCTVDWNTVYQRIDGFGASSAWQGTWTINQANMFFSTNTGTGTSLDGTTHFPYTGIGLSLLRNHIVYATSTSPTAIPGTAETSIMQDAQALGARVWSTPWTPASGFKSNDGPDGGNYLGSGNDAINLAYASQLANYVVSMKNQGINLYAISVQNEPDANVTNYEACTWTGSQIHDFVTNLYSALVAAGVGSTKIIIPESQNWSSNPGLYTPTLSDPSAAADVSIIANHDYVANNVVGDTTTPAPLSVSGQATWETEVSQIGGGYDGSINNAIYWAGRIHFFMTAAQVNAWNYWWLMSQNADNEGLTDDNGIPAQRMYVLGQYSRFVRPGDYRINASNTGNALISAYQDTNSGNFAIVAVNTNASTAISQTFNLTNFPIVALVTPWITSATMSLSNQAPVPVSGSSFTYTLPSMSVVTFVGQAFPHTPPVLTPVANQTVNAGQTLLVTNVVTDPDVPPLTLTFGLMSGPGAINSTNGIFSWRPLVSQANTTNLVMVEAADSGTPNFSATNSFDVIVNPLILPNVSSITTSGGQVTLVVTGTEGPDYTVLSSTNLTDTLPDWQVLLETNSPVTPVTLVVPMTADSARFYRIQIGP